MLFSGGLGWWDFFKDAFGGVQGLSHTLLNLQQQYTINEHGYRWGNSLTTLLVPQRGVREAKPVDVRHRIEAHPLSLGWATQMHGSSDPRVQAMSLADPKILVAILCWFVYAFQVLARRTIGWSGRRAAWLSAIAFAIVLLNFVPVGYFLTRSHKF